MSDVADVTMDSELSLQMIVPPGSDNYSNYEDAMQAALRMWALAGYRGRAAVLTMLRGTEFRYVACVLETGPTR